MKQNFNLLCKIVPRISIRSWEEWVEGFSNLFNKILYDLKPGDSKLKLIRLSVKMSQKKLIKIEGVRV